MSEELQESTVETSLPVEESTTQNEEVESTITQPTEPQFIKVKYNHEEKEIPYSEAVLLAQKGLNYEKALERERQSARDAYIAEQGFEWNGKPITTEAEYKSALREQEMQKQGIDPALVNQILEQHPDVQFARELKANQEKAAQQQAEMSEFINLIPGANPDMITPELVAFKEQKGISLVDAYMRLNWGKQKAEGEQEAVRKLINNAQSSPGSLGNGGEVPTKSVSSMSKADFAKLQEEVLRGERKNL